MQYAGYYRVSTTKQGASGLGLEAQRSTVAAYVGAKGEIIEEFTDIESGKNDKRPELAKALRLCKETGATLLISKLDRLSRNMKFIVDLQEAAVPFTACDMPHANELTIHIFAAMAQHERKIISERTKSGLEAKKERIKAGNFLNARVDEAGTPTAMKPDKNGVYRLGNPDGWSDEKRALAAIRKREKALANPNTKKAIKCVLKHLESAPKASLAELAQELNEYDIKTPSGKPFTRDHVKYIKKLALQKMTPETI